MKINNNAEQGFTLVELVIVMGILVTLGAVAVIYINPTEMRKETRDARRLTDLRALNQALTLYAMDGNTYLGDPHTVYLSTIWCPSNNDSLNLGYSYHCGDTQERMTHTDGTGWIPLNFNTLSTGTPLSHLPIGSDDGTGWSYYYIPGSNGSWVLGTGIESIKYYLKLNLADDPLDYYTIRLGNSQLWEDAGIGIPIVKTLSPTDNAIDVPVDTNFVITFSKRVIANQHSAGLCNNVPDITIRKSNGDLVETINAVDANVTGSGTSVITINPTNTLDYSTSYYITLGCSFQSFGYGPLYSGFSNPSAWNFTTVAHP